MSDPEIFLDLVIFRTYHELFGAEAVMRIQTDIQPATTRDSNGRFAAGCSGNPAGKKRGTRNRATLLAEALRDGEDTTVARVIIDKALAGDAVAARFCIGLLSPKPRGREIALDVPATEGPGDVVAVFDATVAAMASGEITPDEALIVTKVLDGRLRALKALQHDEKLTARDRAAPGDTPTIDDADRDGYETDLHLEDGVCPDSAPASDLAAKPAAAPASLMPPIIGPARSPSVRHLLSACISQAGAAPVAASPNWAPPLFHLHLQSAPNLAAPLPARCA
jgi:hypothetical protein